MTPEEARKIIMGAIDDEVEAYTYYKNVEEKVKDPALKKLFEELAGEETKHRELLETFLAKDAAEFRWKASKDYKIADTLETPKLTEDLKPKDGIVIAIKKEQLAMDMYNELATLSTDAEQERLFTQLANMEESHKARLEDLYTEVAFPEVW
ncbi:MAG: ferritin family protein [Halobacteriota archaeon]